LRTANERGGDDPIVFQIPTNDPGYDPDTRLWTIRPASPLPALVDNGTSIDGRDRADRGGPAGVTAGCTGSGKIVVNFLSTTAGFVASGAYGTLAYLTILGNDVAAAVSIAGTTAHHNVVECTVIQGTAWTPSYHAWAGINLLNGAHDNTIRNNAIHSCSIGVYIGGIAPTHHNTLTGNRIGGIDSGHKPNTVAGIAVDSGAHHNAIGDPADAASTNVISGNDGPGIVFAGSGTNLNVVANNRIGIHPTADQALPNTAGVWLQKDAAANTVGPGNVIAYNGTDGVGFVTFAGPPGLNRVTWNSIHDNVGKGIFTVRLAPPVLTSVSLSQVAGTTNPTCAGCTVEVFANPAQSGAEGKTPLGSTTTQTDGTWSWSGSVPTLAWVTATLTKFGDTSELSAPAQATFAIIGKVCLGWQPIVSCLPGLKVSLLAKLETGGWEEVDDDTSDADGFYRLIDRERAGRATAYAVALTDGRYRVVHAESSRGAVQPNGSIELTSLAPGDYLDNDIYVQRLTPDPPDETFLFSGTVRLTPSGAPPRPAGGVQVTLYGSDAMGERGDAVASAHTNRNGEFRLAALTASEAGFPFYSLAVDDPAYRVVGVIPGLDGEVADGNRVRIEAVAPGSRDGAVFSVQLAQAGAAPFPAVSILPLFDKVPDPTPLPGPPVTDLAITGIELTQAIQCFDQANGYTQCPDNSLELTRGKPIAVRVYFAHTGGAPCPLGNEVFPVLNDAKVTLNYAAITGNLPLSAGAAWGGGGVSQTLSIPCTNSLTEARKDVKGSAVFVINEPLGKSGWKNMLWVRADVSTDKFTEANTANNGKEVTVELFDRTPLDVKWALVHYQPQSATTDTPYTGPPLACDPSKMWECPVASFTAAVDAMYPLPMKYTMTPWYLIYGPIAGNPKYCTDCPDVRDDPGPILAYLGEAFEKLLSPKPDALIGWLPPGSKGTGCGGRAGPVPPVGYIGMCSGWGNPELLAHELGHTQSLWHMDANETGSRETCWPYYGDNAIREVGFDVLKKETHWSLAYDFMSASGSGWISPYMWNKLIGKPMTKEWALVGPDCAPSSRAAVATDRAAAATVAPGSQPAALITGRLLANGTGTLGSVYQLSSVGPFDASVAGAEYAVELWAGTVTKLAAYGIDPDAPQSDSEGAAPSGTRGFALLVPIPDATTRIVLRRGATVLADRGATATAPAISILTPGLGATIENSATVTWAATDADGDELRFALLYSHDEGDSWTPLVLDLDGSSIDLISARWPGADAARVRVLASDGFHTSAADSAPFRVPRRVPMVHIVASESRFDPTESVVLRGHAEDPEDGLLDGDSLVWTSDRQGVIGTGSEVLLPPGTLDAGRHVITLTATDADAHSASASLTLGVTCGGDCNTDGSVAIDDLLMMVNVALGTQPVTTCPFGDGNADGQITIEEILAAVATSLTGCGG